MVPVWAAGGARSRPSPAGHGFEKVRAARPAPHRSGPAPAPGLRAGGGRFIPAGPTQRHRGGGRLMSIPPNGIRRLSLLVAGSAGAVALAVALAAPEVKHALTPPEQRPAAEWSIPDIRAHLEARGLPLELRPIHGPQG